MPAVRATDTRYRGCWRPRRAVPDRRAPHLPWRYLNYRCKNIQARASPSPPRRRTHRLASVSRRLKHWGWGYEDEQPSREEQRAAAAGIVEHLGFGSPDPEQPVPLSDV